MPESESITTSCPLSQRAVIDNYYLENRARILDIASFLDRLDRAELEDGENDFRLNAFRKALAVLSDDHGGRAAAIQMILSDPNTELLEERDQQSADGAPKQR